MKPPRSRRALLRRAVAALAGGLLAATVSGCGPSPDGPAMAAPLVEVDGNAVATFSVGLVPTVAPPVTVGMPLAFRLSSSATGFGHLYLISATGDVLLLAENLPMAAGAQVAYPRPGDGIEIRAQPPAGVDRLVLLVTRQPFVGFANNRGETVTRPAALASTAGAFLLDFNGATRSLPAASWAATEVRVEVVE